MVKSYGTLSEGDEERTSRGFDRSTGALDFLLCHGGGKCCHCTVTVFRVNVRLLGHKSDQRCRPFLTEVR